MNRGALALQKKVAERGEKAKLARDLDVGLDVVSRWVSGERLPTPKQRAEIEDRLKISWRLWDEEAPARSAAS